jgi:hypothetical protein
MTPKKKYAIFNVTLKKYAKRGELGSVANAGYYNKNYNVQKNTYYTDTPTYYYKSLGAAKRQLKYCNKAVKEDIHCIVEFSLTEGSRYHFNSDGVFEQLTNLGNLLYEKN